MKQKSLQVKGVSQKLKNSTFKGHWEIQSIDIRVLAKNYRYIKKCSKRKLVKSRYGAVQSSSISLFTTF